MPVTDLPTWFDDFANEGKRWFIKRLSSNDTGLSGGHQSGPLIAKQFLFNQFPALNDKSVRCPTLSFTMYVDSHSEIYEDAQAKWYWSKNEGRFTRIGGKQEAFLDPENTGTIAVFVFTTNPNEEKQICHAWVCEENGTQADFIEEMLEPIEPRRFHTWFPGIQPVQTDLFQSELPKKGNNCFLAQDEIPTEWRDQFPKGIEIIQKTADLRPLQNLNVDLRLFKRRECEYELFQSIEHYHFYPLIKNGFNSIKSFSELANSLLQSRKKRAGNSLEYHVKTILAEEGFKENTDFSHNKVSEENKRPDFVFPTISHYRDPSFPVSKLRMLACKTTCKDRWRQVLKEADRIKEKHLLTLQEGVSENQFSEMTNSGIRLVVPKKIHTKYPKSIRADLISFEEFIGDLRATAS